MRMVYKYLSVTNFVQYMDKYLDGYLYFADWHSFNDKKEGHYNYLSGMVTSGETIENIKLKIDKYRIKVCSTAGTPDNFRLWHLYAEDHRGLCLGIEVDPQSCEKTVDAQKSREDKIVFSKVKYVDTLLEIKQDEIDRRAEELAVEIIMTKLSVWQQEQEWRFLTKIDAGSNLDELKGRGAMHRIGTVKEIILGAAFTDVTAYSVLCHSVRNKKRLQKIAVKSAGFKVDVVDFDKLQLVEAWQESNNREKKQKNA